MLLIIALIIAGAAKFKILDETVDASRMGSIIYEVTIYNVRDYTAKAFMSGDTVYDSGTAVNIGNIRKVETKPSKVIRTLANGQSKVLENQYKNDVILTIEAPGTMTDARLLC